MIKVVSRTTLCITPKLTFISCKAKSVPYMVIVAMNILVDDYTCGLKYKKINITGDSIFTFSTKIPRNSQM